MHERVYLDGALGTRKPMDVNPIEVQKALKGVKYPASKQELISHARSNDAPDEIVEALENADADEFDGPDKVEAALS